MKSKFSIVRPSILAVFVFLATVLLGSRAGAQLGHGLASAVGATPACDNACSFETLLSSVVDAQEKVDSTGAQMAVQLLSWEALETCSPVANGSRTCFFDADRKFDPVGQPCECQIDTGALELVLDFAAKNICDESEPPGAGLDTLIQLAPIFTHRRSVPPYLWKTPFGDPVTGEPNVFMLENFQRLWDAVADVLSEPKYAGRTFVISVGNEVNLYLSSEGIGTSPGAKEASETGLSTIPTEKWRAYGGFAKAARAYVRSNGEFPHMVGTTLTTYHCGGVIHILGRHQPEPKDYDNCDPDIVPLVEWAISGSDVLPLTYYENHRTPEISLNDPSREAAFRETVDGRAAQISQLSELLRIPTILQEVGQRSSSSDPGALGSPGDRLLEPEQRVFVDQWAASAEARAIELIFPPGSVFPSEIQNRIIGYSFFHLHDFSATPPTAFASCSDVADCLLLPLAPGMLPGEITCESGPADGRWRRHLPGESPAARQEPDVVFDSARGRLVLYGGLVKPPLNEVFRDTWALRLPSDSRLPLGPVWERIVTQPAEGPPSQGAESVYVESLDALVTIAQVATPVDDIQLWKLSLDTNAWTQINPVDNRQATMVGRRSFGRAVYDAESDRIYYFGGRLGGSQSRNDMLVYDVGSNTLSGQTYDTGPDPIPPREEFGFALDSVGRRLILVGGVDSGAPAGVDGVHSDVWQIDLSDPGLPALELTQQGVELPIARFEASLAGSPQGGFAILFGGLSTAFSGPLLDVWRLNYEGTTPGTVSWARLQPENAGYPPIGFPFPPRARHGAAACFAADQGRMVVFGGSPNPLAGSVLDDTWELVLDQRKQCVFNRECLDVAECPPSTFCCRTAAECRASQLGTCVLQSTCDGTVPLVGDRCDVDADCELPPLLACLGGRCVERSQRARFCSWGLIDEHGAGKPAWSAIQAISTPRPDLCGTP